MDFFKCQRCWTQKALFRCPSCDKNQILCNKCDTYIHSMNKYKYHQRYGLSDSYKNITLIPSSIKMNNRDIRKPRPKSRTNNYNKRNKDMTNSPKKNNIMNNTEYFNMNIYDNNENGNEDNIITNLNSNIISQTNTNINSFESNPINNNKKSFIVKNKNNYNKKPQINSQIINENKIKNIQKEVLPYKYNSMNDNDNLNNNKSINSDIFSQNQNNTSPNIANIDDELHESKKYTKTKSDIESIKKNINTKKNNIKNYVLFSSNTNNNTNNINNINNTNYEYNNYESDKIKNQIEEAAKNMIGDMNQILENITSDENNFKNQLAQLENKYTNRLTELENTKNSIINNLKNKIIEINNQNDYLINELSNIENDNNSKCAELTNIINNLKNDINAKEDEIYKIKKHLNEQDIISGKNKEDEKNNLCYLYESKINDILNISDHNQLKLLNIIKEKDRIIQELIFANDNKSSNYNNLINKIQKENEVFKDVSKRSIHLAENNIYNNFINDVSNNYNFIRNKNMRDNSNDNFSY